MRQVKLWITPVSSQGKRLHGKRCFDLWRHTKAGNVQYIERKWMTEGEILSYLPDVAKLMNLRFDLAWYAQLLEWEYFGLPIQDGWIAGKNRELQNAFREQFIFKKTD